MQNENPLAGTSVIKRDGTVVPFTPEKISTAIKKAYLDVYDGAGGERMKDVVGKATDAIVKALLRDKTRGSIHIEDLQDQVELVLMRMDEHKLARGYILYREQHAVMRKQGVAATAITMADGTCFDSQAFHAEISALCQGLDVDLWPVVERAAQELFQGASREDLAKAARMAARTFVEQDPVFDLVVARLTLGDVYRDVIGADVAPGEREAAMRQAFPGLIKKGIKADRLDPRLAQFDLARLAEALDVTRDGLLGSVGVATLFERYLVHIEERRIELPQTYYMRIAMGLALNEIDREARAIEFYQVLSTTDFMNSSPTLFNAGTSRPQLASCFLTTIGDDLDEIYSGIKDNALLQKFAGGLGNDWTPVRALGARIKGTNGKSQGVIPFMKVANDTALAVNQGGKRPGAVCGYLETWHLDMEGFLELRKNTGDERFRTHNMNTANWIPDLFMKRVMEDGQWTLFSPNDVPDLHDLYGKSFETAYVAYEQMTRDGQIKLFRTIAAKDLWRKMLSMLFETGHPWITFKDPCNLRSPQQHVGVVHSSNLCTEITLNTSADEIAVCNIGSINLVNHIKDGKIDEEKLRKTVSTAMRMLDNVIDINLYTRPQARKSNLTHRPVGIGMMGFHDVLQILGLPYDSPEAVQFADESAELLCFHAYHASSMLAAERGAYPSYKGSLWSRGILPHDSIDLLAVARGGYLEMDRSSKLGTRWDALRELILKQGMRNSNCVAIAPTATIGNIVGVSPTIDPIFTNLSVKSNMSGEFTMLNAQLVAKLKTLGVWDKAMLADLKHFDGSVRGNARVPADVQRLFATAFEIDPSWLIEAASRRQKWIDQAQSLNIYIAGVSGKKLDDTYKLAWVRGLKTTYYLRTSSATSVEKSTVAAGSLNAVGSGAVMMPAPEGAVCTMRPGDPGFSECEACQ